MINDAGTDALIKFGRYSGMQMSEIAKAPGGKGYIAWLKSGKVVLPRDLRDVIDWYTVSPRMPK